MFAQYIKLKGWNWNILVYYNVGKKDFKEIKESLIQLDCSKEDIKEALHVLQRKNTGCTFTNTEKMMSLICISKSDNSDQFINTAVHEADHVQSHICEYYEIGLDTEVAAYLIGTIVMRMYKILKLYV